MIGPSLKVACDSVDNERLGSNWLRSDEQSRLHISTLSTGKVEFQPFCCTGFCFLIILGVLASESR